MKTRFDPKKVYIENSISPWISYEGLGRIGLWQYDIKCLLLDYTFYLMGTVKSPNDLRIPCEKYDIIKTLEKLSV